MPRRRVKMPGMLSAAALVTASVLAVGAPTPLAAQATPRATPPTPTPVPTPTPTPPPTGNVVGPPQLRDFNLNGTTTQEPTPAPQAAPPPRATPPVSDAPATSSTTPRTAPRSTTTLPLPAPTPAPPRQPTVAAPDSDPSPDAVTVDLPAASTTEVFPDASSSPVAAPAAVTPAASDGVVDGWWPWLAGLLALALGAGFLLWRKQRQAEAPRYAGDQGALEGLLTNSEAAPRAVTPRTPGPTPPVSAPPRPAPVAAPPVRPSAPPPTLPAAPAPTPAPAPVAGGIVASGLKPRIEFELVPIRAETDAQGGAAVTFDVIVHNRGSAPARDVLVEAQLINAGPSVNEEVGRFFQQPAGTGERVPTIPPMGRVSIRSRLSVTDATLSPLNVEGRSLLVPIVAINALYRWNGGELKNSSSFLVGRGDQEGGKMAPFRRDLGARSWSGLAARLHSTGLQQG